jgi:restriction modification system
VLFIDKHIVDILGTLDEKIEYYDKLINSLEQNGELIFKDFIENKSLLKKHICLSDIATFYNGYSYSGDELCEQSEEALVTIKNFDRNGGFKIEGLKPIKITGKIKPTMFVELGDLLVAHTDLTQNADIIGNPIILLNLGNYKKAAISMDLVKVESSKLSKELLYYILKNSDFKAHALGYCSGTTVLHLNKKALQEYEFDLPLNDSTIEKVNNKLKTIFDRIQIAFLERQKLTELKQLYLQKFFG